MSDQAPLRVRATVSRLNRMHSPRWSVTIKYVRRFKGRIYLKHPVYPVHPLAYPPAQAVELPQQVGAFEAEVMTVAFHGPPRC